jgi:hypothetical protein
MSRRLHALFAVVLVAALLSAASVWAGVSLSIEPASATIGDPISVRVTIETTEDSPPLRQALGPQLGPFTVLDEQWSEQVGEDGRRIWVWSATIATYETGEQEFPGLTLAAAADTPAWETEPFVIDVRSVLDDAETETGEVEIADLKAPASLAPNLAPLWLAAIVLAVLLAVAGLLWWLNRRYAARLAAVPAVEDPFARIAPHEWAFAQLRKLLDEEGHSSSDRFYEQLAWILKRYLGGRYRVDLLELTTDEVRPELEQAGTPSTALTRIAPVLGDCDAVKFAKYRPSEVERKAIVERVYGIIDQTKPVERAADEEDQVGAA